MSDKPSHVAVVACSVVGYYNKPDVAAMPSVYTLPVRNGPPAPQQSTVLGRAKPIAQVNRHSIYVSAPMVTQQGCKITTRERSDAASPKRLTLTHATTHYYFTSGYRRKIRPAVDRFSRLSWRCPPRTSNSTAMRCRTSIPRWLPSYLVTGISRAIGVGGVRGGLGLLERDGGCMNGLGGGGGGGEGDDGSLLRRVGVLGLVEDEEEVVVAAVAEEDG
ncbi:hypothetical protein E2C01_012147 [Portunus trituberculatus]|uniref:Uncharacterized protein n=1 Tax=Portunus trituberculatus TaxID=210409 RepID=A0A5B7DDU5_PORTR|nr:hypothetical protein [Portunus trituberculatus]